MGTCYRLLQEAGVIRLFNADGTVKQEWAGALHTAPVMRQGKLLTQICGSNAVLAEIELADGETIGAQGTAVEPQATAPEPTQGAPAAEPHAPLTEQEVAERLTNAGMSAEEAETLAKLHNDVDNVLSGLADSIGVGTGHGLPANSTDEAPQTATVETPQQ